MALEKGDYVEHWENGIGKVVEAGGGSVTIHFLRRGKIELPREKTVLLKPIDPQGFWAQYFDNPDRVQTLVEGCVSFSLTSSEVYKTARLCFKNNKNGC